MDTNLEHGESGGGTRARSTSAAGGMVPRCGQLVRASTHPAAAPYRSPRSTSPSAVSTPSSRRAPSSSFSFPCHRKHASDRREVREAAGGLGSWSLTVKVHPRTFRVEDESSPPAEDMVGAARHGGGGGERRRRIETETKNAQACSPMAHDAP